MPMVVMMNIPGTLELLYPWPLQAFSINVIKWVLLVVTVKRQRPENLHIIITIFNLCMDIHSSNAKLQVHWATSKILL